jgi:hypothetical protein
MQRTPGARGGNAADAERDEHSGRKYTDPVTDWSPRGLRQGVVKACQQVLGGTHIGGEGLETRPAGETVCHMVRNRVPYACHFVIEIRAQLAVSRMHGDPRRNGGTPP